MTDHSLWGRNVWFLDFEGNKAGEIFLAGTLHSGEFRQVILDYRLRGLALQHSMELKTPFEFIDDLIRDVQNANGVIAAYSNAEKQTIEGIYLESGREVPAYQYCNLHAAAKMWVKRYLKREFADLPPLKKTANKFEARRHPYSLASIMRLLGRDAPADYAIGKTTKRINAVVSGLRAKKEIYQNLTPTQKRQATQLLKHNEFDVVSLHALLYQIASRDLTLFSKSGWTPSRPPAVLAESVNLAENEKASKFVPESQPLSELENIRKQSPNAYKRWNAREEERLIGMFNDGWGVNEISTALGRQIGGVRSRLFQLKLIGSDDFPDTESVGIVKANGLGTGQGGS